MKDMKTYYEKIIPYLKNLGLGGASALLLVGAGLLFFADPISQALAMLFKLIVWVCGLALILLCLPIVIKKMPKKEDLIKEAKA